MDNSRLIAKLIKEIKNLPVDDFRIMEVCGTHTQAISRLGIRELLYPKISLLSGPGCPVCVTPPSYIDAAIELLKQDNMILATFGDLMKVRGREESLTEQREKGKSIRVVYSPLDALEIARENKDAEVVFLGVGFETTAPLIALTIKNARQEKINNLSFLMGLKTMEPVLRKILSDKSHHMDGMICPGHVAAIKGSEYFRFITQDYNIPAVVTGFEALDILGAIYFLTSQHDKGKKNFENLYKRCVTPYGNIAANSIMDEVFISGPAIWRGIGTIENAALCIRDDYMAFDASRKFNIKINEYEDAKHCICSEIILGQRLPGACRLFGTQCNPRNPLGPCMVSSEGSCSIFYKYHGRTSYD